MLPPKQLSIIQALGNYKFLTRLQMARIGIDKYNSTLSRNCTPLVEAGYVGFQDATTYGLGHVYYLTKRGKKFLIVSNDSAVESIHYCANKPKLTSQTLWHRTAAIDCQIELFLSCKNQMVPTAFYDRDFDSFKAKGIEKNLARKTRLNIDNNMILEPDAIFMLETPAGRKLYCLEYEHKDYTRKSIQKAIKHIKALNAKSPSKKYGHPKAHKTLFVYHNPSTMESVMNYLYANVKGINKWFLFKSLDEVKSNYKFKNSIFNLQKEKNFFESWGTCNGEIVSLY